MLIAPVAAPRVPTTDPTPPTPAPTPPPAPTFDRIFDFPTLAAGQAFKVGRGSTFTLTFPAGEAAPHLA